MGAGATATLGTKGEALPGNLQVRARPPIFLAATCERGSLQPRQRMQPSGAVVVAAAGGRASMQV